MGKGQAGTMMLAALVLSAGRASAEIRTDGLSGKQRRAWDAIVRVVQATGVDGRPLRPTLRSLYDALLSSAHVVRIVIPDTEGACVVAGRFRLETVGADGRHEASITLNLRTIDRVVTGSARAQLVAFDGLSRAERRAQVLGHEMAHAAWTLADEANVQLVRQVQERSLELARRARSEGVGGKGFAEAVDENERLVRRLEEPAVEAEAAIAGELRASR